MPKKVTNGMPWYRLNNKISINLDSRKKNQISIQSSHSQVQSKKQPVPEAASPKDVMSFSAFISIKSSFAVFLRESKENIKY